MLIPAILLPLTLACASAQKAEYQTVSSAAAAVEAARVVYYDLRVKCNADPAYLSNCAQLVAAHDSLQSKYVAYQAAIQGLADASAALAKATNDTTLQQKVNDAIAGVLALAADFTIFEKTVTGGK